jgi:hypothetical protein
LTNTTAGPLTVVYAFVLTANGCVANRNIAVTVFPQVAATAITTASPATVCTGTQYQNFGAATPPGTGASYTWTADNAAVAAVGSTGQYSLVSFPNAGTAVVHLTAGGGSPCAAASSYTVTVSNGMAGSYSVIYYNYYFALQDNTQDTYQWGYDDAATLDSTLIPGAVFQSYNNATPDLLHKYYWVVSSKDGCMQKTYFNTPLAAAGPAKAVAHASLWPNPASSALNITFASPAARTVVVTDMTGRKVLSGTGNGSEMTLDVAGLAEGCYLVLCTEDGVKRETLRFVKNR